MDKEIKDVPAQRRMIQFHLKREEKPDVFAYFQTTGQVKIFEDFLKELINNVKAMTLVGVMKDSVLVQFSDSDSRFDEVLEVHRSDVQRIKEVLEKFKTDKELYRTWEDFKGLLVNRNIGFRQIYPELFFDYGGVSGEEHKT